MGLLNTIGIGIPFSGSRVLGVESYPTENLTFLWEGLYDGTSLLNTKGANPTYVSGAGLDAIYDFSVLNDERLDKSNTTYWGESLSAYFYYDAENPYHFKLTDFHYRYFEDQMESDNNFAFGKLTYKGTVLQSVDFIAIYSTGQVEDNLTALHTYIKRLDTFYNNVYDSNFALETEDFIINTYGTGADEFYTLNNKLYIVDAGITSATKPILLKVNDILNEGDRVRITISGDKGVVAGNYWFGVAVTNDNHNLATSGDYVKTGIIGGSTNGEKLYTYFNGNSSSEIILTKVKADRVYENYYQNEEAVISDEIIIKNREADKTFGFGSISFVGNRIYSFYRDGEWHASRDGVIKAKYSDDNGAIWSEESTIYTGEEILTVYPDILIADPDATTDARDIMSIKMNDNYLLVCGFIRAGSGEVSQAVISFCLKIPIEGNELNFDNKIISYLPQQEPFTGGLVVNNGTIYAATYDSGVVSINTSTDGENWTYLSSVFGGEHSADVTECSFIFIGTTMYAYGRGLSDLIIAKSVNNGATWSDYTEISNPLAHPESIIVGDYVLLLGRYYKTMYYYIIDELEILSEKNIIKATNSDIGYGNIVLKDGKYYFAYMNGSRTPDNSDYNNCDFIIRTLELS